MVATWITHIYYGFIFFSPSFFGNAVATFVTGLGPIDRGKLFFDGKPIFGTNKTFGGMLGSTISGGLMGIMVALYFPEILSDENVTDRFSWIDYTWYFGFILGFAAIVGDALGSFIKRRVDLKPGGSFPIMDQIGFVIVAYLIILIFVEIPWQWTFVIPITLIIHISTNLIAYFMGWQDAKF